MPYRQFRGPESRVPPTASRSRSGRPAYRSGAFDHVIDDLDNGALGRPYAQPSRDHTSLVDERTDLHLVGPDDVDLEDGYAGVVGDGGQGFVLAVEGAGQNIRSGYA